MEEDSKMYQFDFLREQNFSRIIKKLSMYDYVSFDIFDTLLKRDVPKPTDVFKLVGQRFNDTIFQEKRVDVERKVRQKSGKEEITLDEIYDELGKFYKLYKEQELEIERQLLQVNPVVYPLYQYCRDRGKKIIITSDMYLPEKFLKDILYEKGITFDFCFISSAYNAQKVTGNLFKKMLLDVGIEPEEIIHIGDSIRGDLLGARKAGIRSILIPKIMNSNQWIDLKKKKQKTAFNIFINNHLDKKKNLYNQFGYTYFGPILYGFVQWLHHVADGRKIFFFARDGYIVKKVYDTLYPNENTNYIYLSRRALSVPLLWKHSSWEEFSNYITVTRFFTLRTFLKRLGLNPEKYEDVINKSKLEIDMVLRKHDFLQNPNLKALYLQIQNDIISNSKNEFNCFATYFKQKQFQGDIVVVDIGWNGSMQRYLVELMDILKIPVKMNGCYFGMRKTLKYTRVYGYLYDPDRMELEPYISFMQGLFESLFLSQEGSTKRYILDGEKVIPVLNPPEYREVDSEYQAFKAVQEGAIDFCKEYVVSPASQLEFYSAKNYATGLLGFGNYPSLDDVALFGNFRFYDTNVVWLAKPESLTFYLRHPKCFVKDFSYSVWKAGFMKRCFKVKIFCTGLYTFLKKIY